MNALPNDISLDTATPVHASAPGLYARMFKRPFELALILLALPVVLPLVALMTLRVAADGGQPFFRQARIGRGGRIFTMWKMRTMVRNAEQALTAHLAAHPEAQAEWAQNQKLQNDPRITRIGARLRATSMDELPQLWNVIKGDMSLIGPRPMLPCQQGLYLNDSYYRLRPGITGLWQVSRRNEVSFAERAQIDATYGTRVTFLGDLRILFKTVRVVLRRTGV